MSAPTCRVIRVQLVHSLLAMLCLVGTTGCALCRIEYKPATKCRLEPTRGAKVIDGNAGRAQELIAQKDLPHSTLRDQYSLSIKARHEITGQLGCHDYVIIGDIYGVGNAYTSMSELKRQMAQRAAKEGGDVLLVTTAKMGEQPFAFTTPGYATTNYYGRTAYTQYQPGATYGGILCFPAAAGIVLKYEPGWDALVQRGLTLDEESLGKLKAKARSIESEESDYSRMLQRERELLSSLPVAGPTSVPSAGAAVGPSSQADFIGTAQWSVVTIHADESLGSGFCVDTPRTILTAAHVTDDADVIFVETANGQRVSAVVVRSDPGADLAVLMMNRPAGLEPLRLRDADVVVGEECFALGSPKGLSGTVTKGIVSAVRKAKGTQLVQTDAAINRGNSGGPLIDRSGQVIGVCDFKFPGDSEGLGFAVGPEAVRQVLNP